MPPKRIKREAICPEAKASGTSGALLSPRTTPGGVLRIKTIFHDRQIHRKNKRLAHVGIFGLGIFFFFMWGVGLVLVLVCFVCRHKHDVKAWTA